MAGSLVVDDLKIERARAAGSPATLHSFIMAGMTAVLATGITVTQVLARHFGYDPRLGAPVLSLPEDQRGLMRWCAYGLAAMCVWMLRDANSRKRAPLIGMCAAFLYLVGVAPLYSPARAIEWWPQLARRTPEFDPLLGKALQLGLLAGFTAGIAGIVSNRGVSRKAASHSHGSAEWGRTAEYRLSKEEVESLQRGRGIGGKLLIGADKDGTPLGIEGGHLITIAGTGGGKGVGTVIPNLLGFAGSAIVNDTKGENKFVTARHRRERLGHTIYALDPYGVTMLDGKPHDMLARFNPLALIKTTGPEAAESMLRVDPLVESIVVVSEGDNKFWDNMAKQVIKATILYICYKFDCGCDRETAFPVETPYGRDLMTMRFLTSLDREESTALYEDMQKCPLQAVMAAANELVRADEKTRNNLATSIQAQLGFLDTPQMANVLADFIPDARGRASRPNPLPQAEWEKIKHKGNRQTTYLVIPPPQLERQAAWLRMMITMLDAIITSSIDPPDLPILAMVDEAGNIGKVEAIRRGVTLNRGYGIQYWLIFQGIPQIEGLYGKEYQTLLGMSRVKQLFATGDTATAAELSKMAGEGTIYSDSGSTGKSLDSAGWVGKGRNIGDSASEKGRKLLTEDEVLRVDNRNQVLFMLGEAPLFASKLNYLSDFWARGLSDFNPYYPAKPKKRGIVARIRGLA